MFIKQKAREHIWFRISQLKYKLKELSGIVQNQMPIKRSALDEWRKEKEKFIEELDEIESILTTKETYKK